MRVFVSTEEAGGSGRAGALRAVERVELNNETLNVVAIVVVSSTGPERELSR
jgi:hypothetical protein